MIRWSTCALREAQQPWKWGVKLCHSRRLASYRYIARQQVLSWPSLSRDSTDAHYQHSGGSECFQKGCHYKLPKRSGETIRSIFHSLSCAFSPLPPPPNPCLWRCPPTLQSHPTTHAKPHPSQEHFSNILQLPSNVKRYR